MEFDDLNVDPDAIPGPVCGVIVKGERAPRDEESNVDDPLLSTPLARLYALATEAQIVVDDISNIEEFAGGIAVGYNDQGVMHGMVFLADDLNDDLRADALAFGIAVLAEDSKRVIGTPDGYVGIGRERLPAAPSGPGHLAWHMLRSCGRETASATFDLVDV